MRCLLIKLKNGFACLFGPAGIGNFYPVDRFPQFCAYRNSKPGLFVIERVFDFRPVLKIILPELHIVQPNKCFAIEHFVEVPQPRKKMGLMNTDRHMIIRITSKHSAYSLPICLPRTLAKSPT